MTNEEEEITQENQTPEWLKTIQLNSWEAELLISALVLYALFQLPEYIDQQVLRTVPQDSQLHGFFGIVVKSIYLLRIGYFLHILVRGLWVASVGLSYVFPKGIDRNALNFKGKFDKELESKNSLVSNVLRLEELSSIIYGVSFLVFGSLLGFGTLMFTLIFFAEVLNPIVQEYSWTAPGYLIIILFYLVGSLVVLTDFITAGFLRRKKWAVEWFYPIAYIFRFFTLSFLYRRSLLVLTSNVKGWKSRFVPLTLLLIIIGFWQLEKGIRDNKEERYLEANQQASAINANYENLRDDSDLLLGTIQSDVITDNTLRVFLKDLPMFRQFYAPNAFGMIPWSELPQTEVSNHMNTWLSVKIDSVDMNGLEWFRTQHINTYDFGLITYIDLDEISRGTHSLTVAIDSVALNEDQLSRFRDSRYHYDYLSNIHFFYDKP